MSDRLTRGFIAGIIAGIVMNVPSYIAFALDLTTLRFVDWTAIVIFGHAPPFETGEMLFGLAAHLIFTGSLGIVFLYLITQVTSKSLLLKGWLFGVLSWFVFYSITLLFEVEGTLPVPLRTALSNFVGS